MKAYADLAALKRSLGITSTDRDSDLLTHVEAATGEVDAETQRTFQPYQATQLYDYQPGGAGLRYDKPVWIADLLTLDTLLVDGTAWTVGDYTLLPTDAPTRKQPYTRISPVVGGTKVFTAGTRTLSLTGLWGYQDERRATGATLTAGIDASQTTISVSSLSHLSPGMTIRIDSEQLYVTLTGDELANQLTVVRGVNGSTAASHLSAAAISRYTYPRGVVQETLARAGGTYRVDAIPAGITRETVGDITIQYGDAGGGQMLPGRDRLHGLRRRAFFA